MSKGPENVGELLKLATKFSRGSTSEKVKVLYRNKNDDYFEEIMSHEPPMMRKKLHTLAGLVNPRSPLQGKLAGVFFCVTLWKKHDKHGKSQLPDKSPYGPKRVKIPLQDVFGDGINLYFADFYCIGKSGNKNHYVILVLTKPSSEADKFCKDNLKSLASHDNPFLWKKEVGGKLTFYTTQKSKLWVEVLYTEDVDITGKTLDKTGPARPKCDIAKKDEACVICNGEDDLEKQMAGLDLSEDSD